MKRNADMKLIKPASSAFNKFKRELMLRLTELKEEEKSRSVGFKDTIEKQYDDILTAFKMKLFVVKNTVNKNKAPDNLIEKAVTIAARFHFIQFMFKEENMMSLVSDFVNMMNNMFTSELINKIRNQYFIIQLSEQMDAATAKFRENIKDNLIYSDEGQKKLLLFIVSFCVYAIVVTENQE